MKKILIWGTGEIANRFLENGYCGELLGFIETCKTRNFYMDRPVYDSTAIPKSFDYIIIANRYGDERICPNLFFYSV